MNPLAGPGVGLGAAAVLGTADFAGGLFSKRHSPAAVTGWSHGTAFTLLVILCAFLGFPTSWGWLPWAVGAGACSGLGLVAFYGALAQGTMGVVAPIASAGVIVPVLFGLLRGETLSGWQVAGAVVAIVGIVLAAGPEFRSGERHRARAIILAALSGIAFGAMMVGIMMGAQHSPIFTQLGMRGTSGIGFVLYALFRRSTGNVSAGDVVKLAGLGILDVCGNLLMAWSSLLGGMVSVTAVIVSLYSVVTVILAAIVLKERLTTLQLLGVAAALAGVVLLSI